MAVSIVDVAALAGVSPTTVSHAMSGKRVVRPVLRQRVEAAMRELGYVPRRSARSLALGRTETIGLLVPDITNGFFASLAASVEAAAIERGYNVILGNTGFDPQRELVHLRMVTSRAVDGVVYATGAAHDLQDVGAVLTGTPLVLVDEELPGFPAAAVVSDNADGGRQVADHLLGLGHRHALVAGASEHLPSSVRRVHGFVDRWRSTPGATVDVVTGGFTVEGGLEGVRSAARPLLARRTTAVFAVNDLVALGVVRGLRELGLRVPADVSVVGFDDSPIAEHLGDGLTSVRQDVAALGVRATEVLIDAVEAPDASAGSAGPRDPTDDAPEMHPVELVPRASSGPPPR